MSIGYTRNSAWRIISDIERSCLRQPRDGKGQGTPHKPQIIIQCGNPLCKMERFAPTDIFERIGRDKLYCKECFNEVHSLNQLKRYADPKARGIQRIAQLKRYRSSELFDINSMPNNRKWIERFTRSVILNKSLSAFAKSDFVEALNAQEWICGFPGCTVSQLELNRAMIVDHDHLTKIFRALLCDSCNRNMVSNHRLKSARNLVAYLEKTEIS